MLTLQGKHIFLRALEPEDLDTIYAIENDESLWHLGDTHVPFSKHTIKTHIEQAHLDIYETKQLRLAICLKTSSAVIGLVDLFDFDAYHERAGVGIMIVGKEDRRKGYATDALQVFIKYTQVHLKLHQVYANILASNLPSINLFEKLGFQIVGVKKQWRKTRFMIKTDDQPSLSYEDELMYQLLL